MILLRQVKKLFLGIFFETNSHSGNKALAEKINIMIQDNKNSVIYAVAVKAVNRLLRKFPTVFCKEEGSIDWKN